MTRHDVEDVRVASLVTFIGKRGHYSLYSSPFALNKNLYYVCDINNSYILQMTLPLDDLTIHGLTCILDYVCPIAIACLVHLLFQENTIKYTPGTLALALAGLGAATVAVLHAREEVYKKVRPYTCVDKGWTIRILGTTHMHVYVTCACVLPP